MCLTKRLLSAALCVALLLSAAGCAKNSTQGSTQSGGIPQSSEALQQGSDKPAGGTGKWIEEEITLPEEIRGYSAIQLLSGGKLLMFARTNPEDYMQSKAYTLTSEDNGKTWTQEELVWDNEKNGVLSNIKISENGTKFFETVFIGETRGDNTFRCFIQRPGEEIAEYGFDGLNYDGKSNILASFIDDTTMFIVMPMENDNDKLHAFYDISENKLLGYLKVSGNLSVIPVMFGIAPAYDEKRIYLTNYNNETNGFDLCLAGPGDDFNIVYDKIPTEKNAYSTTSDKNGTFYFANEEGIFSIAKGGSICEKIVDANAKQLNTLGSYILCRAEDGSFISLALAGSSEEGAPNYKLLRYYFDENAAVDKSGDTLRIWSLEDNITIREAIASFSGEKEIEYTVGIPKSDQALNRDDVIRTLQTEILAGSGPDILILDGLDDDSYINKDMLLDLSTVVDSGSLVPFIKDAFFESGKTYLLPLRFTVPVIMGDEGSLKGIKTLTDLQNAIIAAPPRPDFNCYDDNYYAPVAQEDRYAMSFLSTKQLCDFVLSTSAAALINNNKVDIAAAEKLYGFVGAVAKHSDMKSYRPDSEQPRNGIEISGGLILMDAGYEYSILNKALYAWENIIYPQMFFGVSRTRESDKKVIAAESAFTPGLCEAAYTPTTMIGISAQTTNRAQAEQFLKHVFSGSGQSDVTYNGMSTIKKLFDLSIKDVDEKAIANLNKLKTPVIVDNILSSAFFKSAEKLINGEFDEKAAAADFEKNMSLYLAERE